MLSTSLIPSAVLLIGVIGFLWSPAGATGAMYFTLVLFLLQFACLPMGGFLTAFALNSLLILIGLAFHRSEKLKRARVLGICLVLTAASYGLLSFFALRSVADRQALQKEFPVESLAPRLQYELRSDNSFVPADQATVAHASFAKEVGSGRNSFRTNWVEQLNEALAPNNSSSRNFMLRKVHENAVQTFIDSPAFGVARMLRPNAERIRDSATLVAQPGTSTPEPWLSAQSDLEQAALDDAERQTLIAGLNDAHDRASFDFVDPNGIGVFENRERVLGFLSHRLSRVPEPIVERAHHPNDSGGGWKIQSVELVSLLKFPTPQVYVSEYLPRMEELRDAPTRELDEFEQSALAKLRSGDEMADHSTLNHVRMLGALRALKQCSECHFAKPGTLLGAFSYRLERVTPRPKPVKPAKLIPQI